MGKCILRLSVFWREHSKTFEKKIREPKVANVTIFRICFDDLSMDVLLDFIINDVDGEKAYFVLKNREIFADPSSDKLIAQGWKKVD